MKPNEMPHGYVPLVEAAESGNLKLPVSYRALACMRLMDLMAYAKDSGPWRVLIDPSSADIMLQQTEQPALEETPPTGSSWSQPGYALAVNMAYILIGAHPYKGRRWYESPILSPERLRELFVDKPEFILATTSAAPNAPQPIEQAHVKALYNSMPKEMRERLNMKSAFALPDGKAWFGAEPLDQAISRSGLREMLWAVWRTTSVPGKATEKILVGDLPYTIQAGKRIVHPDTLEEIGYVMELPGPKGPVLAIYNNSNEPWIVEKSNPNLVAELVEKTKDLLSCRSSISPGKIIQVTSDTAFMFEDGGVRILTPSK